MSQTATYFPLDLDLREFTPSLTLASDFKHPKERAGVPVHYFDKQMLKPGIKLPDKRTGLIHEITPARIQRIYTDTKLLMSRGFEPSLPIGTHNVNAAKNAGWLADLRIDADGSLVGVHGFIGSEQEARELAAKYKTSVNTVMNFDDSEGHTYGEVIDHNALVPNPKLILSDFVPAIAASRGQAIDVVELSLAAPTTEVQMDLSKLRTRLGAAADVPDEKVIELAEQQLGTLKADADKAVTLSRELEDTKLELSRSGDKPKPSAEQLHYLGKMLSLSRDEATRTVGAEYVTKAQKQFLGAEMFDTGGLTLAREPEEDDAKVADGLRRMIDVCELAKYAKVPVRTQAKGIEAARHATENALDVDKDQLEGTDEERKALRERVKARMGKQPA